MYRCADCNNPFSEPEKVIEHQFGYNLPDGGYNEVYYSCPFCGSNDYEEVVTCCMCNEEFPKECKGLYVHDKKHNEYVCNDCLRDYFIEMYS